MVTSVILRNFYTKAWQPWSHEMTLPVNPVCMQKCNKDAELYRA